MTTQPTNAERELWHADNTLEAVLVTLGAMTGVGDNISANFQNDAFVMRDFCWCSGALHPEDEDGVETCPPNFEHFRSGLQGQWYKRLGRSTEFNRHPEPGEAAAILQDCLNSVENDPRPPLNSDPAWGWKAGTA